jgi:hypothetical protein
MPPGRQIASGHLALLCNSAISQTRLIHVTNVTAGKTQRIRHMLLSVDIKPREEVCCGAQRVAASCMGALGRWDEYMNSSAGFDVMHIWFGGQISRRMFLLSHDGLSRMQTRSPIVYTRTSVAADSRFSEPTQPCQSKTLLHTCYTHVSD